MRAEEALTSKNPNPPPPSLACCLCEVMLRGPLTPESDLNGRFVQEEETRPGVWVAERMAVGSMGMNCALRVCQRGRAHDRERIEQKTKKKR